MSPFSPASTKTPTGSQPEAHFDPGPPPHWDLDDGKGGPRQHFGPDGTPLPVSVVHPPKNPYPNLPSTTPGEVGKMVIIGGWVTAGIRGLWDGIKIGATAAGDAAGEMVAPIMIMPILRRQFGDGDDGSQSNRG